MSWRSIVARVFRCGDLRLTHGKTLVPAGPGRATDKFPLLMKGLGPKARLLDNLMSRLKPRPTNLFVPFTNYILKMRHCDER
jgi:hypothetical protein